MAEKQNRSVALLSIKPPYAEAILNGRKRVEFRRVVPTRPIEGVVVYATAPVQRVIGYFDVPEIESAPPKRLWKRWREWAGIAKADYDDYFSGKEMGHAIHVGRVVQFHEPFTLTSLQENLIPPQSFAYLADDGIASLDTALADRQAVA